VHACVHMLKEFNSGPRAERRYRRRGSSPHTGIIFLAHWANLSMSNARQWERASKQTQINANKLKLRICLQHLAKRHNRPATTHKDVSKSAPQL
jgi:hypothetical protein